jgi:hypothetical protein
MQTIQAAAAAFAAVQQNMFKRSPAFNASAAANARYQILGGKPFDSHCLLSLFCATLAQCGVTVVTKVWFSVVTLVKLPVGDV